MRNCGYTREPSLRLDHEFMIDENGLVFASKATKFRKEILCAVRVNPLKESVALRELYTCGQGCGFDKERMLSTPAGSAHSAKCSSKPGSKSSQT